MTKPSPLPEAEILRNIFSYDSETGEVRRDGRAIIHRNQHGYYRVGINGRLYVLHRVIWKMVTGEEAPATIDHIDHDNGNNRWSNLRLATNSQQAQNRRTRSDAQVGLRGAHKVGKRWQAMITLDGVRRHIGMFDTPEAANAAYEAAARKGHGDFYLSS